MSYCPKCKNEYREGFTVCTECNCELVDSFEEPADQEEDVYPENESDQAPEEQAWEESEAKPEVIQMKERPKDGYKSGIYRNNAERAEDNKSSAWTLLSVGVIGIILLVLVMVGVIPLYFYGVTRFMVYGVMFALFILFIVMGMVSLRNSRIFAKKAESDSTLSDTMREWCLANLKAEALDEELFGADALQLPSELKYFKRNEELKRLLSDKFMNLDEGFLEDFVDHVYEEVFKE